jgi:uncharacterized protein (DUF58 family)
MVRIQLRGGLAALLLLLFALLLALLAFAAGLAFLLPLAALGLLAAAVRSLSGLLSGRRRDPAPDGRTRLPASEQVIEVSPVEPVASGKGVTRLPEGE